MIEPLYPRLCPRNARLGLMNPSSPADEFRFERGLSWLRDQGFELTTKPSTKVRSGLHAGSIEERTEELNSFLRDPDIDGVLFVRGGSGSTRLLPHLDYDAIRSDPKLLVGLSDPTAILLGVHARTGLVSVSGQMVVQLHEEAEPYTVESWRHLVHGPWPQGHWPLPDETTLQTRVSGEAQGRLFPFNFSLFTTLIGTPYLPDLSDAILVIEEIDERPEGLDRMVAQFEASGLDRQIGGIVLAQFTHCLPRNEKLTEEDGLRVVWEWAAGLGVPVVSGFPYGHEKLASSLPCGAPARLIAPEPGAGNPTLEVLASPSGPIA